VVQNYFNKGLDENFQHTITIKEQNEMVRALCAEVGTTQSYAMQAKQEQAINSSEVEDEDEPVTSGEIGPLLFVQNLDNDEFDVAFESDLPSLQIRESPNRQNEPEGDSHDIIHHYSGDALSSIDPSDEEKGEHKENCQVQKDANLAESKIESSTVAAGSAGYESSEEDSMTSSSESEEEDEDKETRKKSNSPESKIQIGPEPKARYGDFVINLPAFKPAVGSTQTPGEEFYLPVMTITLVYVFILLQK
jgi:cell division septation protein DedD